MSAEYMAHLVEFLNELEYVKRANREVLEDERLRQLINESQRIAKNKLNDALVAAGLAS